jgi:spoIIIJ-associated protein
MPSTFVLMTALEHSQQILENMLGYLGFFITVDASDGPEGPTLQIHTDEADYLIGRNGEVLEDVQYLVNRLLMRRVPEAPRIRVDVEYFRTMREDTMLAKAQEIAERVRTSGRPEALNPMNSYYRRLIHNAFAKDPHIATESEKGEARFKRVTLKRR